MTSLRGAHPVILSGASAQSKDLSPLRVPVTPSRPCHRCFTTFSMTSLPLLPHCDTESVSLLLHCEERQRGGPIDKVAEAYAKESSSRPYLGAISWTAHCVSASRPGLRPYFRMTLPIFPSHPGFGPYFPDDNSCYAIRRFQNATGATQGSPTNTIVDK